MRVLITCQGVPQMKLKSTLATFASALLIAGYSYASNDFACPSISAIKAEGLSQAEEIYPSIYFTYNISNYSTDNTWGFVIAPVEGDSVEAALETGNEILAGITSEGVPGEADGYQFCQYETGDANIAAVAFMSNDGIVSPMKLKHFYHSIH